MYHIILCDDDIRFLHYMKKIIVKAGLERSDICFYEYTSGEELERQLAGIGNCDLLILDMQMPGMDGDAAARAFRRVFPSATLVFCSGVCQPTTKSFETTPFRYLLKSYTDARMLQEVKAIVEKIVDKKSEPVIIGRNANRLCRLKPDDILYIEISRRGSCIHLHPSRIEKKKGAQIITDEKVADLYARLKAYGFAYAHNSYIVNVKYVEELYAKELELIDGTLLSVSRSREKEFRAAFVRGISDKY
ncbi:MAG: response regulator transcription factor [Lachnospiraceae bacterium]|nr:response regulator transcription factor [Lachnospiraceae bacterium]